MKLVVASLLVKTASSSHCSELLASVKGNFKDDRDAYRGEEYDGGTEYLLNITATKPRTIQVTNVQCSWTGKCTDSTHAKWTLDAHLNTSCQANFDFPVQGASWLPPVHLQGALYPIYYCYGDGYPCHSKAMFEFTNPSGHPKSPLYPVNTWVSEGGFEENNTIAEGCPVPESFSAVYADMKGGDEKVMTIKGHSLTIRSNNASQTWTVKSTFSRKHCKAVIDMRNGTDHWVEEEEAYLWFGKPVPPSGNNGFSGLKTIWEFRDYVGEDIFTQNHWVELPGHPTTTMQLMV